MNILELSEKRFSARKYTAEPVAQSDLDYIMECVRLAPSAVNKQPWKFVIVRSEEAKQKLWRAYDREWFRTAPLYIVCMKNNNACWTRAYDDKSTATWTYPSPPSTSALPLRSVVWALAGCAITTPAS